MRYQVRGLTKTPFFWITFLLIFIAGSWFALHFFSKAFPIIDLEITMDRKNALTEAKKFAQLYQWGPQDFKQAASFGVDNETKNFIELEGGGISKFKEILNDPDYSPYSWSVRHFKEYEINEVTLYFTPEGTLYGFKEQVAEDQKGAALTAEQARAIALANATTNWKIDFTHFAQAETSQEIRPNGRIDHTFVYERTDKKVGEAPYRLTLVVSGDTFTQLKRSIKAPEGFIRRYQEMRSSNSIIAFVALAAIIIFYVFGGFIALFYLMRRRWLLWKIPLILGVIIGILQAAVTLNELPLYWTIYPTSLSLQGFLSQILVQTFLTGCAYAAIATLIIMLAESLSRKAFGHQIQLWRMWGKTAGHSIQVIGRTLGGYLILGFDFAFAIGLYYIALRYFGWWSPSEELYNPNILAHYLPWLSPLVLSFCAGFLEECLFRAVPLAGAALLGNRFGKRTLWISGAFIAQAIIFGAAHASYPAQPAYARLIELIIPSFVFGGIYLQFGLLPSIISHYIYDVVWFSLPIFVSSAPTIFFDKIIIILGILFPLLVVVFRLIQAKKITTLPAYFYNRAWQKSPENSELFHQEMKSQPSTITVSNSYKYSMIGLGCLALLLWLLTKHFQHNSLPVEINRKKALEIAHSTLGQPTTQWHILSNIMQTLPDKEEEQKQQHHFVWKTAGKNIYHTLLSEHYLKPHAWFIRFVRFDGDVIQRAEEHQITVRTDKSFIAKKHIFAENASLPTLSLNEARKKALEALYNDFNIAPGSATEISASPKKLPERTDWTFIYRIVSPVDLKDGQQRITISLAGNEVNDAYRSIFVPETWKRNYTEQKAFKDIITTIADFIFIIIMICAIALLTSHFNFHYFSWQTFLIFFTILFVKSFIQFFNIWPTNEIQFSTIEPFNHQLWQTVLLIFMISFAKACIVALLAAAIMPITMQSPQYKNNLVWRIIIALSTGIFVASIYSIVSYFQHPQIPLSPNFAAAGAYFPGLSAGLINLTFFIEKTVLCIALIVACDIFTNGWQKRKIYFIVLSIVLGIAFMAHNLETFSLINIFGAGILLGLLFCLAYIYILRFDKVMLPWVIGGYLSLTIIQQTVFNAYSGAILGGILSLLLILAMIIFWMQLLRRNDLAP